MKQFILLFSFLMILLSCSKKEDKSSKSKENPLLTKAYQYYDINKMDSALIYFNEAKEVALQQKDSLTAGNSLILMGMIATNEGDHFGAQEFTLKALSYLNKKDTTQYASIESCLSNLGNISSNLDDYDRAINFFKESLSYSKNSNEAIITKNSLANAYREKKDYQESMKIQQGMLKHKIDKIEYARILSNLTYTKWLNNPNYNAQSDLLKALSIRLRGGDHIGLNASFSHLADYYEKMRPDSAFFYADRMYHNALGNKSPDDQLDALQKLVKLSPPNETKSYFLRYQQLNDSIKTTRNKAKNQFALVRYETEKHKADNIVLQQENTVKKYQLIIIIVMAILIISIGIFRYRKRQQDIKRVAENTIRENQLKTSKKVHDVVANGLYRVMTEIENEDELNRDKILDKIEEMYERSRDISYEKAKPNPQAFDERLQEIFNSFSSTTTAVKIKGNTSELWNDLSATTKNEIEHVLQELMVNMKKHSKASLVNIQFQRANNSLTIVYTDNGIGLTQDYKFNNGLTNTGNRMAGIQGTITFDTIPEKGLSIQLAFPIS